MQWTEGNESQAKTRHLIRTQAMKGEQGEQFRNAGHNSYMFLFDQQTRNIVSALLAVLEHAEWSTNISENY